MSVSILAKTREFADFWHKRLCRFYKLSDAQNKNYEPLEGDMFFRQLKHEVGYAEFEYDMEVEYLNNFIADVRKNAEYIPLDMKATYYELNLEIMQLWSVHINKLKRLQRWTEKDDESDRRAYQGLEHLLDSTFDYFICKFDELAGAIRVMQSCQGIRELLQEEAEQEKACYKSLRYERRIREKLENGICRIRDYMNSEYEHQNDNYLDVIANDIAEICEDTLSEVSNMPFDETEETGFIG